MQAQAFCAPILVLAAWTHVMLLWMYGTRLPAIRAAGMELDPNEVRGAQASLLPAYVRWKSDNYTHLLEQPTLFYAVCVVLAFVGQGSMFELGLAWAYVALRIVHSLHQALNNRIPIRFGLFAVSSLALFALTGAAGWALIA